MNNRAKKKSITPETALYYAGLVLLALAAILFLMEHTGLLAAALTYTSPCSFHVITHLYCPGCGGTRAVIALLHGRLLASFLCHPIVPYLAVLFVCFMFTQTVARVTNGAGLFGFMKKGMAYRHVYLYIAAAILLINFVARNLVYIVWGLTCLD